MHSLMRSAPGGHCDAMNYYAWVKVHINDPALIFYACLVKFFSQSQIYARELFLQNEFISKHLGLFIRIQTW